MNTLAAPVPLRLRLAARGLDGTTLLAAPALLALVALFVYPFAYGVAVSLAPKVGPFYDSYRRFFADPFMRETIGHTLALAVPTTVLSLLLAVPIAFRVRLMRRQRLLTTILVLPVTLGTVLVAQGLLTYLGPQGWFDRVLIWAGVLSGPVKLTNNYWGVFASLVITGFPFTFLLTLSAVSGIDPALEHAAATLGASVYANQGQRVVVGQRLLQAEPDEFLGWSASEGRDFYVRRLKNPSLSAIGSRIEAASLPFYARLCGRTLARAHARAGDAAKIAGYLGEGESFDDAIAQFAMAYADQTDQDFARFQDAIATGQIEASTQERRR